jgi:hypothetical protein
MQVVPLSAAANIPAAAPPAAAGVSDASPEAVKSHQAAVKRDIEATTAHQASRRTQAGHPKDESEPIAAMPLILKNKTDRFAFQFGRGSALRSTSELVDQLQEQLRIERAQHRFNLAEKEKEIAILLRELAEMRLQLARFGAFASAPSPSAMVHQG